MLRFFLITILVIVLAIVGAAWSVYSYLSPEEPLPKLAAPSSVRTTESGTIIGFQGKHDAHTWLGIPYAQAPVMDLRWKAPRPPIPWEGRKEMLEYGNPCVQLSILQSGEGIYGDEDCLTLNIWAPVIGPTKIPTGEDRLPVMFWIHGGGNTIGSGGSQTVQIYDGSLMATEHNVIVVTINYRLGLLGWFAHSALRETSGSPESASGNFGTLDIIAALTWVQNNIANFGGDPSNVTIYGESAGGTNTLSMMASPLARGLFQKAIVQSGVFEILPMQAAEEIRQGPQGTDMLTSREVTARLLMQAGRAIDKDSAIAMQDEMSARELSLWLKGFTPDEIYGTAGEGFGGMIFAPAVFGDGYVLPAMTTEEVFGNPANYTAVPIIIGSNREETALFMAFFDEYVEKTNGVPSGIKDPIGYRRDVKYGSDLWRAQGVDQLAELMSLHQGDEVYAYRFDADDWRNLGFVDLKDLFGAAHGLELPFVFGYFPKPMRIIFPDSTFPEIELLSGAMMSYWAEFAHGGQPGTGHNGEQPAWLPWAHNGGGSFNVLDTDLDGGIRMEQGMVTIADVRAAFFADESFASTEEKCRSYRSAFFVDNFDQQEYASLGCE